MAPQRRKIKCPLCGEDDFFNLRRHLKSREHGFTDSQVEKFMGDYNDVIHCKPKELRNEKYRMCYECRQYKENLGRHLREGHKYKKTHPKYKPLMAQGRKEFANRKRPGTSSHHDEDDPPVIVTKHPSSPPKRYFLGKYIKGAKNSPFSLWLKSSTGSKKCDSDQMASYVRKILTVINKFARDLNSPDLAQQDFTYDNILHGWFEDNPEGHQPNSRRVHLCALRDFVDYLQYLKDRNPRAREIKMITDKNLKFIRTNITNLSKSLTKDVRIRHHEYMEKETREAITTKNIRTWKSSEYYKTAKSILAKYRDKICADQSSFTIVRDFLLIQILLSNAHRPSSIVSMTLDQFRNAARVKNDRVVTVTEGKTVQYYGPAKFAFDKELYEDINTFIRNIRPLEAPEFVFTKIKSYGYKEMTSNLFYITIANVWKKAVPNSHLTATRIRRLVESETLDKKKKYRHLIGAQLQHKPGTVDKHYIMRQKVAQAAKAGAVIRGLLNPDDEERDSEEEDSESEESEDSESDVVGEDSEEDSVTKEYDLPNEPGSDEDSIRDDSDEEEEHDEEGCEETDSGDENTDEERNTQKGTRGDEDSVSEEEDPLSRPGCSRVGATKNPTKSRQPFPPHLSELMKKYFKDFILSGTTNSTMIRERIKETPALAPIEKFYRETSFNKVRDHLRSLINKQQKNK